MTEYQIGKAHVRILPDAYAGCSEEEIERRKETAQAVCERIIHNVPPAGEIATPV